jgi:hypothetical protein
MSSQQQQIIEIIVNTKGEVTVQTKGFTGSGCREASRFIEQALGQRTSEQLTPEFYASQSATQQLKQEQ